MNIKKLLKNRKFIIPASAVLVIGLGVLTFAYIIPMANSVMTTAEICGETIEFRLVPGTVERNLKFNRIEFDDDDEIRPALDQDVDVNSTLIRFDEVHYSAEFKTEKVKAEYKVILDPKLDSGVEELVEGNDGKGVFTYKTKWVNGEEADVEKSLYEWKTEPHDTVLHLGTGRTGHTGTYKITDTFIANCSAYWMGDNCYGAGGGHCEYGTVAVDRHIYAYGTMFWIEGYGFAIANDCGTSIKGNKLDLWMDSYDESCRWGRRHMTTYVLEEE